MTRQAFLPLVFFAAALAVGAAPVAKTKRAAKAPPVATDAGTRAPLTPQMVDGFFEYFEWVFATKFDEASRTEAKGLIESAWANNSTRDIQLVEEAFVAKQDMTNYSDAERTELRQSVEDEYAKFLRRKDKNGPLAQWLQRNAGSKIDAGTRKPPGR